MRLINIFHLMATFQILSISKINFFFNLKVSWLLNKHEQVNRLVFSTILVLFYFQIFPTLASSKTSNDCVEYKVHIKPLVFRVDPSIDTNGVKANYRYIIDSLKTIYYKDSNKDILESNCDCCMVLVSEIIPNNDFGKSYVFEYKLTVRLVDNTLSNEIYKVEIYFKDLSALIMKPQLLKSLIAKPYTRIFKIFGDTMNKSEISNIQNKFIFFLKEHTAASSNQQSIADSILKYIILRQNSKIAFAPLSIIDTIEVSVELREGKEKTLLLLSVNSKKSLNFFDKDGKEIKTEYSIDNSIFKKTDYSFIYGKITNFVSRLNESNF